MRRTRAIRLALLGTVGVVGLAACDDGNPLDKDGFYRSEAECTAASNPDTCRQAYADAQAQHIKTAPAFASREACETKFGAENCMETKEKPGQIAEGQPQQQASAGMGGGSWFMPMMMGYMIGNMMGGRATGQPVYRDTTNTAYSGNKPVGRFKDHAMPPPRAGGSVAGVPSSNPAGTNTSRGGFGSSSSGYSGSGS